MSGRPRKHYLRLSLSLPPAAKEAAHAQARAAGISVGELFAVLLGVDLPGLCAPTPEQEGPRTPAPSLAPPAPAPSPSDNEESENTDAAQMPRQRMRGADAPAPPHVLPSLEDGPRSPTASGVGQLPSGAGEGEAVAGVPPGGASGDPVGSVEGEEDASLPARAGLPTPPPQLALRDGGTGGTLLLRDRGVDPRAIFDAAEARPRAFRADPSPEAARAAAALRAAPVVEEGAPLWLEEMAARRALDLTAEDARSAPPVPVVRPSSLSVLSDFQRAVWAASSKPGPTEDADTLPYAQRVERFLRRLRAAGVESCPPWSSLADREAVLTLLSVLAEREERRAAEERARAAVEEALPAPSWEARIEAAEAEGRDALEGLAGELRGVVEAGGLEERELGRLRRLFEAAWRRAEQAEAAREKRLERRFTEVGREEVRLQGRRGRWQKRG